MTPLTKRDWKRAAWKQTEKPQGVGWLIGGVILILAILKVILFP